MRDRKNRLFKLWPYLCIQIHRGSPHGKQGLPYLVIFQQYSLLIVFLSSELFPKDVEERAGVHWQMTFLKSQVEASVPSGGTGTFPLLGLSQRCQSLGSDADL